MRVAWAAEWTATGRNESAGHSVGRLNSDCVRGSPWALAACALNSEYYTCAVTPVAWSLAPPEMFPMPAVAGDTVADLDARFLVARGVNRVFCLQGGPIQPVWDRLAQSGVHIVDVRDEGAAVALGPDRRRRRRSHHVFNPGGQSR